MVNVKFVQPDGEEKVVSAEAGQTVLTAAMANLVDGIIGECGGNLSCATCHVYIDPHWASLVDPKGPEEEQMLEGTSEEPTDRSRLCCQIHLTAELDGLVVQVPASQR